MKKLLLVDGNTLIFRAYYATQNNPLKTTTGIYTNAVHGFINMFESMMKNVNPSDVFVAFDTGEKTFRHEKYDFYKAQRKPIDDELKGQFSLIRDFLTASGISWTEEVGYEADDIIGIISKKHHEDYDKIQILTGDKDLLQLIDEKVEVILLKSGVSNFKLYDVDAFVEEYGLKPIQMIDLKAIQGDPSDNIPGVKGIGIKGATKLLQEFDNVENIYASLDSIKKSKQKEYLVEYKESAFISKELATIFTDKAFDIDLSMTNINEPKINELEALFIKLEMKQHLKRSIFSEAAEEQRIESVLILKDLEDFEFNFESCVINVEAPSNDYQRNQLLGLSLHANKKEYYIPAEFLLNEKLINWLENPEQKKQLFDYKKSKIVLQRNGINLQGVDFDFLLAGYVINSLRQYNQVSDLEILYGEDFALNEEDYYGKTFKKISKLEEPQIASLSNSKVKALYSMLDDVKNKLHDENLTNVYELEFQTCEVLIDMESNGILINTELLESMTKEYEFEVAKIADEIWSLAGVKFNIDSPKQLGDVLFEVLKLPVVKKTKTGYSTGQEVLEQLAASHEIIPYILAYRQKTKILNTYLIGMKEYILEDNKIHTVYNQALTQTGRLSSQFPNLQNIPTRTKEGKELRKLFIAEVGNKLLSIDYSQIELRMVAHLANETKLIQDFVENKDIHKETAARILGISVDEVTNQQRSYAKATNFGIIYGLSAHGLAKQINVSRVKAQEFIDKYFETYPQIQVYMDGVYEGAKLNGFVSTIVGRKRYLPDINSSVFPIREASKRAAINAPVQGSAADLLKVSMIKIFEEMKKQNMQSKMLLQIHDELVFEVKNNEEKELEFLAKKIMESAMDLLVPLDAEYKVGQTLYETK